MDMNSSELQEMEKGSKARRAGVHGVSKSQTQLRYRTATKTEVIKTSNVVTGASKRPGRKKQEAFKYNGVNTIKGGISF